MPLPDDDLDRAWRAGQAAWPGVVVDRARFAAHVATLDLRYGEDLYLAIACIAGDPIAIEMFDRDVLALARGAIAAIDSSPAFVDEAMQRLRESLLVGAQPRLLHYAGRGPLRAWTGVAAARHALMIRRSQKRAREVPVEDDDSWTGALAQISTSSPELDLVKRQYATAFQAALRDAVASCEPRMRAVLRMSFVDALSIDQIGAVYAVHRATAARWIQRACDTVFAETRRLLTERLALTPSELDRMTAMVQSQLEVSVSQLLPAHIISDPPTSGS